MKYLIVEKCHEFEDREKKTISKMEIVSSIRWSKSEEKKEKNIDY